jgi:hypothetical protein
LGAHATTSRAAAAAAAALKQQKQGSYQDHAHQGYNREPQVHATHEVGYHTAHWHAIAQRHGCVHIYFGYGSISLEQAFSANLVVAPIFDACRSSTSTSRQALLLAAYCTAAP